MASFRVQEEGDDGREGSASYFYKRKEMTAGKAPQAIFTKGRR